MACRITRSREWGARLEHELPHFEKRCFATFTYNWEHVPRNGRVLTLRRYDLQLALKRLRKAMEAEAKLENLFRPVRQIKYFGCGEYGDDRMRPHYHLIVLGIGLDEHEILRRGSLKGVAVSGPLVDCWKVEGKPIGNVMLGTAERDSIRYVADYLKKALSGERARRFYRRCERPFQCVSQGIGKRFAVANGKQLRTNLGLTVGGQQVGLPRYYRKVLDITAENTPELVKRGLYAHLEHMEVAVNKTLREGGSGWFEARLRAWVKGNAKQRAATLEAQVRRRRKGVM